MKRTGTVCKPDGGSGYRGIGVARNERLDFRNIKCTNGPLRQNNDNFPTTKIANLKFRDVLTGNQKAFYYLLVKISVFLFIVWGNVIHAFGKTDYIDLTREDVYIRRGFDHKWLTEFPPVNYHVVPEENPWVKVPGTDTGNRPLRVVDLPFDNVPERHPFSLKSYSPETFTFITEFQMTQERIKAHQFIGLYLAAISDNWEVYLNGNLLKSELYISEDGSLTTHRSVRYEVIQIDPRLFKPGQNILAFKIIGDPTYSDTGFYLGKQYLIGNYNRLLKKRSGTINLFLVLLYLLYGIFLLFMYIRRPKNRFSLIFAIACGLLFLYTFAYTSTIYSFVHNVGIMYRISYFSLFVLPILLMAFFDSLLVNKIHPLTKIYGAFCTILAILVLFTPLPFITDLLRLWQITAIVPLGYILIYRNIFAFISAIRKTSARFRNFPSPHRFQKSFSNTIFNTVPGSLLPGTLILCGTATHDILDSLFWASGFFVSQYGFFLFMTSISLMLINLFIKAQEDVEKLNINLENQVAERTVELTRAKQYIESVFNTVGDGISVANINGELQDCNKAYLDTFGYSHDEIIGKKVNEFFPPEEIPKLERYTEKLMKTGKVEYESINYRKDGTTFPIAVSAVLMNGNEGIPAFSVASIIDITDRKQIEAELMKRRDHLEEIIEQRTIKLQRINKQLQYEINERKSTEEKLHKSYSVLSSIIESPEDIVIFALDRNYCYTAFNTNHKQTIKKIWGADIKIGLNMLEIIKNPEDRRKAKKNFDRVLKGERFTLIEEYGEPPNRFYYEDVYNPIFDDAKNVIGLTLFLTDVTERNRVEAELRKHHDHLAELVKERTAKLSELNEQLQQEISDRKIAEAAVKRKMVDFAQSRLAALNMMEDANAEKLKAEKAEKEAQKANKSLADANTRLREMMAALEKTKDELKLALEAAKKSDQLKSEFLANTSHELRTPLNSIIGFLQLICDGMCDSVEEEREFITNALDSSHHLLKLINDVLDIAKIEAGEMKLLIEAINLGEIFEEIYLLTHVQAEQKKISLDISIKGNRKIYVNADYQKLKQILINLVGNSLKFTLRGGITISAEADLKYGNAAIQVIDTGIGIPKEKQSDIFQMFAQADGSTSRRFGGTGLGLSITKSLVELMGGEINLVSAGSGKGTTVTLNLPLANKNNEPMTGKRV